MGSEVAAPQLQRAGSVAGVHGLRCFVARGTLPGSGMELCPLHWQVDS